MNNLNGTVLRLERMGIFAIRPICPKILKGNCKGWVWVAHWAVYEWVRVWTRGNWIGNTEREWRKLLDGVTEPGIFQD